MKKIFALALAALFVCGAAMAQEEKQEKKKGGFMNAIKKGVESTTGLDVSKETVFVYPEIGEWKMSVASCMGDPASGEVTLKLKITRIASSQMMSTPFLIREARVTGSKELLALERLAVDALNDFRPNAPVEVTLGRIGAPAGTKLLDIKFSTADKSRMFEARDVPVEWKTNE